MQRALTIVAIAVAIAIGAAVLWGPVFAFIGGFALLGLLRGAMTERVVVALVGAALIAYIATLISNAVADSNKAAERKAVAAAEQSHADAEQLAVTKLQKTKEAADAQAAAEREAAKRVEQAAKQEHARVKKLVEKFPQCRLRDTDEERVSCVNEVVEQERQQAEAQAQRDAQDQERRALLAEPTHLFTDSAGNRYLMSGVASDQSGIDSTVTVNGHSSTYRVLSEDCGHEYGRLLAKQAYAQGYEVSVWVRNGHTMSDAFATHLCRVAQAKQIEPLALKVN